MAFEDLGDRYNSGFGREIDDNINRNQGGDGGRRRRPQTTPPLGEPPVVVQKPFSRLAQKIIDGNPQNTDYELGQNTTFINPDEKIKIRKVDLNNLGTAGQLGTGDYVLESLYLKTHKNNPDRQPINTGRIDENGNPILIPTIRAGMGNLDGLDIKGYSSNEIFYRGTDRGNEPYQIANIGTNDAFYGRDKHVSRLVKFYKSPAGQQTLLKENLLSFLFSPKKFDIKNLKLPAISSVLGTAFQRLIGLSLRRGHHNLFTNLGLQAADLSTQDKELLTVAGQTFTIGQLGDLGNTLGSLRRPFAIEYSARKRTGMPYGDLGDRPWNLSILRNLPVAETRGEGPDIEGAGKFDKLRSSLAKGYNKLIQKGLDETDRIANQTTTKVTPFFDLGGGPANHNDSYQIGLTGIKRLHGYDDKIAYSGVEYAETTQDDAELFYEKNASEVLPLEDEQNKIQDGDFYVRWKDLRDGGYIYFRGYITGITENLSPSWTPTNYIGRSEPVYSYERAERDVSFNLAVFPSNYKEEVYMYNKIERLTSMVYPEYMADNNGSTRMKPPFTEMYMAHIGNKTKGQFGYIKSLSYTVNESGDWNAVSNLPRVFNIAISYQIIGKRPPALGSKFYASPYGSTS